MHKALQALVDTFLLIAGSVELGGTGHSPIHSSRVMPARTAAKPWPDRELLANQVSRSDLQPPVSKPSLRTNADKSRP